MPDPVTGARIRATCQISQRAAKVVDQEVDPDEIPSPLECQAIARAIPARFGTLVRVLYALGLRLGEATALDVTDWNPTTAILRVKRSNASTDRTKGHRPWRDVDVSPVLAALINDHINQYCHDDGPLFPGTRGGRLSGSNFRKRYFYPAVDKALAQAAKDAHQRRRIRPHDLRHTAATMMIHSGVSDIEIAKQLGHRDTTVTRRVYAGVWRRIEREVSAKMDAQLAMVV